MLRPPSIIAISRMKFQCSRKLCFNSFSTLPRIQLPSPKETHLWYVKPDEVKNESLLNQYVEILSPREKEIVFQIHEEGSRKNALLARALVRTTIARYQINSQVSPRSLKFVKNAHGKPEIGIDVEEKNRVIKHNILSLARRYFSKHEVQVLSAIPDPQVQHQEFMKLWILKEAYVKALGRGFSGAPFKTFTIRIRDAKNGSLVENSISEASEIVVDSLDDPTDLTSDWEFVLLDLARTHYAAICTKMHAIEGKQGAPKKLMVWKTIPFVEDELVSGTEEVLTISGLI